MNPIKEVLQSGWKPKEKVAVLAEQIKLDETLFEQLIEVLETGSDVEKGTCADVMKHVTKDNPEIAVPYVDVLAKYITYKAPRVKWGVQESIGHIARKFPEEVEKTVPALFVNTKDESTVVRWCAAFALSEIAKNNRKLQKELAAKFEEILKTEKNNGVRNVYLKALKAIGKT